MIGDGLGIAHRTAARIMQNGVRRARRVSRLVMDTSRAPACVMTASLQLDRHGLVAGRRELVDRQQVEQQPQGVFPDDTTANFDNPRVEIVGEYLAPHAGQGAGHRDHV